MALAGVRSTDFLTFGFEILSTVFFPENQRLIFVVKE